MSETNLWSLTFPAPRYSILPLLALRSKLIAKCTPLVVQDQPIDMLLVVTSKREFSTCMNWRVISIYCVMDESLTGYIVIGMKHESYSGSFVHILCSQSLFSSSSDPFDKACLLSLPMHCVLVIVAWNRHNVIYLPLDH